MREAFGLDLDGAKERFVFAGDSPNDAPMFAFFPNGVGVANIRRFLGEIATPPAWITTAEGGHGFAELAGVILAARRAG
jgi:hydroxymethylpyrimidine pyrophosphatase-like HAD family hydrolase